MNEQRTKLTASEWWSQQRLRYNIGLAISGLLAFVVYACLVSAYNDRIPDAEISGLTIVFQVFSYILAMGIANVFYFLGPISERLLKPSDVEEFRRSTYRMGFWFSVLLPFSIPLLIGFVLLSSN